ncbi:hypothetical protein HK100_010497, partial [Physocladia obscura]
MSSSNQHRPSPKKSSASSPSDILVAPFPALPGLSFEQVVDFAHQVQEALSQTLLPPADSAKQSKLDPQFNMGGDTALSVLDDPSVSSLSLLLVSPHQLNYRFSVALDNSVFVIFRKPYLAMKMAFVKLDIKKYSGIYL